MFHIQYDKTGRFRLLHSATNTRSAWLSYQETARIQVGGKTFLAQVGPGLLPEQERVYGLLTFATTVSGERQPSEEDPPTKPDLRKSSPFGLKPTAEREVVRRTTPTHLRKIQPRIFLLYWTHRMDRPQEIRGHGTDQVSAFKNAYEGAGFGEENVSYLHHWEEKVS